MSGRVAEPPIEATTPDAAAAWQRAVSALEQFLARLDDPEDDPERVAAAEAAQAAMDEWRSVVTIADLIPTEDQLNAMTAEEEARWAGVPWHEAPARAPVAPVPVVAVRRRRSEARPRAARRRLRIRSGSRGDPSPSDDLDLTRRARARRLGVPGSRR